MLAIARTAATRRQYVKPTVGRIGHVAGEALAKHSKTSTTIFDLPLIVANWKSLLQQEILLGDHAYLLPATRIASGADGRIGVVQHEFEQPSAMRFFWLALAPRS